MGVDDVFVRFREEMERVGMGDSHETFQSRFLFPFELDDRLQALVFLFVTISLLLHISVERGDGGKQITGRSFAFDNVGNAA